MKNKNPIVFFLAFISLIVANAHAALPSESGSLKAYLDAIEYGSSNDERFKVPNINQITTFESGMASILAGNYLQAHTIVQPIGFEVVSYTDTDTGKHYYILREVNPIPSPLAIGGGYYIFNPSASRNVAIQIPHPKYDMNTNYEGVEVFLATDVKYLFLAGAHRRSSPNASTCQDFSNYRVSDAVHNVDHLFYSAHKVLEDFDNTTHYIELHGFGTSSRNRLQEQCDPTDNLHIVNLSETRSDLDPNANTLMHALEQVINGGTQIAACIYSNVLDTGPNDLYSTSLGATTNTAARYTNGSTEVCGTAATDAQNTHRYLHVEQSSAVRSQDRTLMATYINQALNNFFSAGGNTAPTADFTYSCSLLDCNFDASSSFDSNGTIASYQWSFGNTSVGSGSISSHVYASAGTYTVSLTVTDNDGETNTKAIDITVSDGTLPQSQVLSYDDFEAGFGSFTGGGSDARVAETSRAHQGEFAANIQDNTGVASSFYHTNGYDVRGYNQVSVDFWFKAYSMESGEDFFVEFYDGSQWQVVANYKRGSDFENNIFYHKTILIDSSAYNFSNNMKIRFRCDASSNADDVYIDEIEVKAIN